MCALGKKPELINYILTTSSSKPAESDKYFPCKKVDTSVVISVPASPRARNWKLTSFSRFNLPPATFMENWRQQVCLCSAMCLHVNECQCPLATIECRQCVDIVVLTDDNVPMLDNQCYTPIISCVPPSAGSFTPTAACSQLHTFAAQTWGDTRTPSEDADWQRPISSPLIDTKYYADKVLYSRGQIQMQTRTRVSTPRVALCPNGFSFEFYWCGHV